jgi:integrase/recombinase XerD
MQDITIPPDSSVTIYQEQKTERGVGIDALIQAWLHAKEQLSHSPKTQRAYEQTIQTFRSFLQQHGYDLIFSAEDFAHVVADFAQAFAAQRSEISNHKGRVSSATQAQRFAILSSFYAYAIKRGHLSTGNPIDKVDRPKITPYGRSQAINYEELKRRLETINMKTEQGMRDMAILSVFLYTGRRVSEVANLAKKDLLLASGQVVLTFQVKGGDIKRDILDPEPSRFLLHWLTRFYGEHFWSLSDDLPLWVDLHHKNLRGQPLKYNGFAGICQHYLGTTKVHTTRHSFAVLMEVAGAKLTDIQRRLGHKNAATTGIYMEQLTQEENAFSGEIGKLLGFKKEP